MNKIYRRSGKLCPVCGEHDIQIYLNEGVFSNYDCYVCTCCGGYFASDCWNYNGYSRLQVDSGTSYSEEKLKSYLFYHKGKMRPFLVDEKMYESFNPKELTDIYNLTPSMVEAWYPKTFAEKVDKILLYMAQKTKYMGEELEFYYKDLIRVYFIGYKAIGNMQASIPERVLKQIDYLNGYFEQASLLSFANKKLVNSLQWSQEACFQITPKGWERIDELQKNHTNNRNVFIAMKFGDNTLKLRNALKQAILDAGYWPILIDEVQYNGQIIPEMLYQIRESRFMLAELSDHNNGAYYEAGYALGLGKEVIHICNEQAMREKLHFDVKQVNTITYKADDLEGLKERLIKRIQATIK